MNYTIVDIETTGGSPKTSKITEIALFKYDGEKIVDSYESLVNPEIPIQPFVARLTGINDAMVAHSPKFFEIAKQIIEFTEGCVFVAHNVGFDYGILRHEFQSLGFDFRRPHLCTVRASRHVIPNHKSYSLGKLCKSLDIQLTGRHRAGGDAYATAQLFSLLLEKDKNSLTTFIQEALNPKILHPNLDVNAMEELPNKTGVYRFVNEDSQLLYIGKSKQIKTRVKQHLRNTKTKKGNELLRKIARIEFELTGSELIAMLYEEQLIKQHQPPYNRQYKTERFPYGLFGYEDSIGYKRLHIAKVSAYTTTPITSFSSKKQGVNFLAKACEEFNLCQKLCDLYTTQSSCFHYEIKQCNGACVQEEEEKKYNQRVDALQEKLSLGENSYFLIGKGRKKSEKSLVMIENGSYAGFGFAPYHFNRKKVVQWHRFITRTKESKDARTILQRFLRKKENKIERVII